MTACPGLCSGVLFSASNEVPSMVGAVAIRRIHSGLRALIAFVIFAGMFASIVSPAFAAGAQSGDLQGHITTAAGAAIAGATVTAASPTGSYNSKTDASGYFRIIGMNVDTYTISISSPGYETLVLRGVTLEGDQAVNVGTQTLSKTTAVIGRTTGRSPSSVFQPAQTTDSYTISGDRILETTGKTAAIDETALALAGCRAFRSPTRVRSRSAGWSADGSRLPARRRRLHRAVLRE